MVITRDGAAAVVVVDMAEFEGIRAAKERTALLALRAMGREEVARGEVMTVDEARRLSAGWFAS